ncbi:MAG: hypothetical protein NTU83_00605 [Candidatus Hydrogenedentes bacterium]|nr:hypothetical protein [Candidatus Hydrogenedentota bacterium]
MPVNAKRVIWRLLLFGLLGLLIEVFFTSLGGLQHGNYSLHGHTSPWMMIDYCLFAVILMPVGRPMARLGIPLPVRAIVYMIFIFATDLVSGWVFDVCVRHPYLGLQSSAVELPWLHHAHVHALLVRPRPHRGSALPPARRRSARVVDRPHGGTYRIALKRSDDKMTGFRKPHWCAC